MKLRIGCDLVYVPKFIESVEGGGQLFVERLFTPYELSITQTYESLAGIFAVKEALVKAGFKPKLWHDIELYKKPSGRPFVRFSNQDLQIDSVDVSISHDGDYAMAYVIVVWVS